MNQRVHNLSKWRFVAEGESISYPKDKQRSVILDVNCPSEVAFYVVQDAEAVRVNPERLTDEAAGRAQVPEPIPEDGDRSISFLGLAKGRDRFEFAVDGAFDLLVEGGSAYVYTADGQDIATRVVAPVIFTRIANRRQRNPHLEWMQLQMRLNTERMMSELEEESERRIQAVEAKLASYAPERRQGEALGQFAGAVRRPSVDETGGDAGVGQEPVSGAGEPDDRPPGRKRSKDQAASDE